MKQCLTCGIDLVYGGKGRRPTHFCSRSCKSKATHRGVRAQAVAERGERKCPVCGGVISEEVTLKAGCCSRACGVTYQNRKRAEAKRAKVLAERKPCEDCGSPIPSERRGGSKFCSAECKGRAHSARWRARSPHYMRQYLYGISEEQYVELMEKQGQACAICGSKEWPGKGNRPCVDHDHETGKVRSLLCSRCNLAIGHMDDDPRRLRAAADYLERFGAINKA